jgi:hypothetical protein
MPPSKNIVSLKQVTLVLLVLVNILSCNQNEQQTQKQEKQTIQTKASESSIASKEIPIWSKSIPDSELITGALLINKFIEL